MKCGSCVHAIFERTPTGRIKKAFSGKCAKAVELLRAIEDSAPPCVSTERIHVVRVWHDMTATNCTEWKKVK